MGLYDDEKITTGEFSDWDYLSPKYTFEMLEASLKSREPESKVGWLVDKLLMEIKTAEKRYPDLVELAKWKAKAEDLEKKINKNAPDAPWKTPFNNTWDTQVHKGLWTPYHRARAESQAENWAEARKQAEWFLEAFETQSNPTNDQTLAQWYRQMTDDQKQRFAGYVGEMKTIKEQADKKLA